MSFLLDDDDFQSGASSGGKKGNVMILELISGRNITDGTTVNSSSGMEALDIVGKVALGNMVQKLPTQHCTNDPVWKAKFNFDLGTIPEDAVIVITMEAKGKLTNTLLGEVRIPISNHRTVNFDYAQPHWYSVVNPKLRKKDGSPGEVSLKIGTTFKAASTNYTDDYDNRAVEDIYEEANVLATESNQSAQRTLETLKQARDIASNSNQKLNKQGDQIGRMQNDMATVQNNVAQSERKLNSIESMWGTLTNKFSSGKNKAFERKAAQDKAINQQRDKMERETEKSDRKNYDRERKTQDKASKKSAMAERPKASAGGEFGLQESEYFEKVNSTEKVLDEMDDILDDVKGMATDMNMELREQNTRLDMLNADISRTAPRIDSAARRTQAINK